MGIVTCREDFSNRPVRTEGLFVRVPNPAARRILAGLAVRDDVRSLISNSEFGIQNSELIRVSSRRLLRSQEAQAN